MTLKEFYDKVKSYEESKPDYSSLLYHIAMKCQEDFLALFEKAEKEGKELYLIAEDDSDVITLKAVGIH